MTCDLFTKKLNDLYSSYFEDSWLFETSQDYFTYLTYYEIGYLLYELKRIDMSSLTMQIINTVYLMQEMESKQIQKKTTPVLEVPEQEIIDRKPRIRIEEENVIPEI